MGDNPVSKGAEPRIAKPTDTKFHDFPRPTVAVDTALLSIDPDRGLVVVELARDDTGKWALPGTFLRVRETLSEAVARRRMVIGETPRRLATVVATVWEHRPLRPRPLWLTPARSATSARVSSRSRSVSSITLRSSAHASTSASSAADLDCGS